MEPPAKRTRDDECYSDSSEPSDSSDASDAEEDNAYLQVCDKFQNLLDEGCGCREGKTNHYRQLHTQTAQKFMFDILQLTKNQRKSYALASLAACYRTSATERQHSAAGAAGASGAAGQETRKWYCYAVLVEVICKTAFTEMRGLTKHTIESMQAQVKLGNVVPAEHKSKGVPNQTGHTLRRLLNRCRTLS